MADLEAVLADVSYLMAMEKSKCTPAARKESEDLNFEIFHNNGANIKWFVLMGWHLWKQISRKINFYIKTEFWQFSREQSEQEDNSAGPECEICDDQIPREDWRNQFWQDIQSETGILAL